MNEDHILTWLQNWYKLQCNGDWEHESGITIETIDNPGWYVTINLKKTNLENKLFLPINVEIDDINWFFCLLRNDNFEASCGPCNLLDILQVFRKWAEN